MAPLGELALAAASAARTLSSPMPYLLSAVGFSSTRTAGDPAKNNPTNRGSIAAWAWGYSRCVDYLVTDRDLDAKRIAAVGHSRNGKTALLAAALDERVALVVPSQAGCGGSAPCRLPPELLNPPDGKLIAIDDWRRPAAAGNRCLPSNVLTLAPMQGQSAPGQHGARRGRKMSEYGQQLRQKQLEDARAAEIASKEDQQAFVAQQAETARTAEIASREDQQGSSHPRRFFHGSRVGPRQH